MARPPDRSISPATRRLPSSSRSPTPTAAPPAARALMLVGRGDSGGGEDEAGERADGSPPSESGESTYRSTFGGRFPAAGTLSGFPEDSGPAAEGLLIFRRGAW